MEDSYLSFKAGDFFFLLPLDAVVHIFVPRPGAGAAEYEGMPVFVHHAGPRLIGRAAKAIHAVLLREAGGYHALLVEQVTGVERIFAEEFREIPGEVLGPENSFLGAAVNMGPERGWAYLLDPAKLLYEESKDAADV